MTSSKAHTAELRRQKLLARGDERLEGILGGLKAKALVRALLYAYLGHALVYDALALGSY